MSRGAVAIEERMADEAGELLGLICEFMGQREIPPEIAFGVIGAAVGCVIGGMRSAGEKRSASDLRAEVISGIDAAIEAAGT